MSTQPCYVAWIDTVILEDKDLAQLDPYHKGLLRMIQTLSESTAKPAVELLLGCLPAQVYLHQKMLSLYITILHRLATPEHEVIVKQLTIKDLTSYSWTVQLWVTLDKYNLPQSLVNM